RGRGPFARLGIALGDEGRDDEESNDGQTDEGSGAKILEYVAPRIAARKSEANERDGHRRKRKRSTRHEDDPARGPEDLRRPRARQHRTPLRYVGNQRKVRRTDADDREGLHDVHRPHSTDEDPYHSEH